MNYPLLKIAASRRLATLANRAVGVLRSVLRFAALPQSCTSRKTPTARGTYTPFGVEICESLLEHGVNTLTVLSNLLTEPLLSK